MQQRQELAQKKMDAGLVSERFPRVATMEIQMTYYQRPPQSDTDKVLMLRTMNISPASYAYFHMQCPKKECEGGFDLAPIIRKLVREKKNRSKGSLVCKGRGQGLKPGHTSIEFAITIRYNRCRKK